MSTELETRRAEAARPAMERCVVVVDEALPAGLAANAAAVLAFTLGARLPGLIGEDFADADGMAHPGLIPFGVPVLGAPVDRLAELRAGALAAGVGVVAFPSFGQQSTDYAEFRAHVARTPAAELCYLAVALHGARRAVARLTGSLPLLR
jgi:uncharacterized protein DUF2000